MNKELQRTLRFVSLIAIPLCFVNSMVLTFIPPNFLFDWSTRFFINLVLTFPQAVLYVSLIKWYNKSKDRPKG